MGTIKRFEDLEIWQLARELLNLIYDDFRFCKDFTLKNQVIDAGLSVMNNIAEGFSRDSDKEFKQFLNISKGSDGEVKSMYYVAEILKPMISSENYTPANCCWFMANREPVNHQLSIAD